MNGHQCACDCARARREAWARARLRSWVESLLMLWTLVALVGSCVLYAYAIPESWNGPWVWAPILITWSAVTAGPFLVYRRRTARRALRASLPNGRHGHTGGPSSSPPRAQREAL